VDPIRRRTLENKNEHTDERRVTEGRYCNILKSLSLGYFGYVEIMQNQRMPEEVATPVVEGKGMEETT
jgi:hypothetical protein